MKFFQYVDRQLGGATRAITGVNVSNLSRPCRSRVDVRLKTLAEGSWKQALGMDMSLPAELIIESRARECNLL